MTDRTLTYFGVTFRRVTIAFFALYAQHWFNLFFLDIAYIFCTFCFFIQSFSRIFLYFFPFLPGQIWRKNQLGLSVHSSLNLNLLTRLHLNALLVLAFTTRQTTFFGISLLFLETIAPKIVLSYWIFDAPFDLKCSGDWGLDRKVVLEVVRTAPVLRLKWRFLSTKCVSKGFGAFDC